MSNAKLRPVSQCEINTPTVTLSATDEITVIRMSQLTKLVGLSRSMIYLKINSASRYFDESFPKPIRLGQKAVGWLLSDVYRYINNLRFSAK